MDWKCKICGYEWKCRLSSIIRGSQCPKCVPLRFDMEYVKNFISDAPFELLSKEYISSLQKCNGNVKCVVTNGVLHLAVSTLEVVVINAMAT